MVGSPADVHKAGWCLKCPPTEENKVSCSEATAWRGQLEGRCGGSLWTISGFRVRTPTTEKDRELFATGCIAKGVNADGSVKDSYKCAGADLKAAQASIAGF